MITRYIKHGLSVSMAIFEELDITQHAANDMFFDRVWNMLKDGGVYIAPNGSTPTLTKDADNRRWIVTFESDHPQSFIWSGIGCQKSSLGL